MWVLFEQKDFSPSKNQKEGHNRAYNRKEKFSTLKPITKQSTEDFDLLFVLPLPINPFWSHSAIFGGFSKSSTN
jgi:hypothetical protein